MTIADVLKQEEAYLPETIRMLFPHLNETELDKVQAMNTLLHSQQIYEDMYLFEDIILALNDVKPDFEVMQGVTPEQIFYAFYIISKLNSQPFYFDWEVKQWIKYSLNMAGVYFYPPELGLQENNAIVSYEAVREKAANGPFPLEETILDIQASRWLAIQLYINNMIAKDVWSQEI